MLNSDSLQLVVEELLHDVETVLECRLVSGGWHDVVTKAIIFKNGRDPTTLDQFNCPVAFITPRKWSSKMFRLLYVILTPTIRVMRVACDRVPHLHVLRQLTELQLTWGFPLWQAAVNCDLEEVEQLARLNQDIEKFPSLSISAIHHAVLSGNCKLLAILLRKLKTSAGKDRLWGGSLDSGLFLACERNLENVVAVMMAFDVNPNHVEGIRQFPCSPLCIALQKGHHNVVKLLLQHGANPDVNPPGAPTPLCIAALKGDIAAMQLLVEFGASVNLRSTNAISPIYAAAWGGSLEATDLLASEGADVNHPVSWGETPYGAARRKGHSTCEVSLQIRWNASAPEPRRKQGKPRPPRWLTTHGEISTHDFTYRFANPRERPVYRDPRSRLKFGQLTGGEAD